MCCGNIKVLHILACSFAVTLQSCRPKFAINNHIFSIICYMIQMRFGVWQAVTWVRRTREDNLLAQWDVHSWNTGISVLGFVQNSILLLCLPVSLIFLCARLLAGVFLSKDIGRSRLYRQVLHVAFLFLYILIFRYFPKCWLIFLEFYIQKWKYKFLEPTSV